jgi:hypothetical protein
MYIAFVNCAAAEECTVIILEPMEIVICSLSAEHKCVHPEFVEQRLPFKRKSAPQ